MATAKSPDEDDANWGASEEEEETESIEEGSSDNESDEWDEPPASASKRGRGVARRGFRGSGRGGRGRGSVASRGKRPTSNTTPTSAPVPSLSCPNCGDKFDSPSDLEAHLREKLTKLGERQKELKKESDELLRQLGELEGSNQSELAKRQMRVKKQDEDLQTEISRVEEALRSRQIAAMLNVSDEDLKQKLLKALKIAAEDVQSTDSVLGEGTFSEVRVGLWRRIPVAVKSFTDNAAPKGLQAMQDAFLEWGDARHPNVAAIYGFLSSDAHSPKIVMEILEGSLLEVMRSVQDIGASLAFREQVELASGILSGLHYLHNCKKVVVIHSNVWPANILITPFWNPKITDIGLAKYLKPSPASLPYRAPELCGDDAGEPTKSSDRFSAGAVLFEVFSGSEIPRDGRPVDYELVSCDDTRRVCNDLMKRNSNERIAVEKALAIAKSLRQSEAYKECPPPRRVTGRVRRENEEFFATI